MRGGARVGCTAVGMLGHHMAYFLTHRTFLPHHMGLLLDDDLSHSRALSYAPVQIVSLLEAHPLLLARILDRDLPVELIDLCQRAGLPLLPSRWYDLRTRCSCPDDAPGTMKHVRAQRPST